MSQPETTGTFSDYENGYWNALKIAYAEACRIYDRDSALGMEEQGIIDNMLGALAKLAGVP
jgi:hypothetical protein